MDFQEEKNSAILEETGSFNLSQDLKKAVFVCEQLGLDPATI
jgi:hypothetical protein